MVEDNPVNQKLILATLETFHYTASLAGSGEEALEILKDRSFDLILMDIDLPGIDGLEYHG